MRAYFTDKHRSHAPGFFLARGLVRDCEERPERADILMRGARRAGLEPVAADDWPLEHKQAVHDRDYLEFLAEAHARWSELEPHGPEVIANVHPNRHAGRYPDAIVARAGWHMADTACAMSAGTWPAALASADVALSAAAALVEERAVYALCRPPGHHAFSDMAGGHCFLNNCAIAAAWLRRRHERVAILDVDVHHGNGTQQIFYDRDDVLTVSIHADPHGFYPFFWGHADETGEGAGEGYNLNYPLPVGTDDSTWLSTLDRALERIDEYRPGCLVVALGLDAYQHDPLSAFRITPDGFRRLGERLGAVDLPMLLVQEGGYLSDDLAVLLERMLGGFKSA